MKATKNNGTFEALNTTTGARWTATRGEIEVWVGTTECGDYLATLWADNRPMVHAEGTDAHWALKQLAKECEATNWDDADFFSRDVFPLCKDLNDFMKRPMRETYNSR